MNVLFVVDAKMPTAEQLRKIEEMYGPDGAMGGLSIGDYLLYLIARQNEQIILALESIDVDTGRMATRLDRL